ncbi:hypothetical protein Pint_18189 [Pistacia integerrima]|uniref:Uncharacterized protein n=1 Tax=Pistacia integerrima TaxID=434235 RepID=A0ACC0YYM3_9ROSI|nr:hypothetical protein Pint_18189 [Pistacia integerrima]
MFDLNKRLHWYADSSFAINCGGSEITLNNIVYESDNEPLGPATYYLANTNSWGVSNVGYFENDNAEYIISSGPIVTNTKESILFQRARISASSLRYYGLGLQNGKYIVTLQFAELANFTATGWKSLGRRVFNIYVQGNLVEKDFDITRATGGVIRRAVQREYQAHVSENYMEIHFFWAGKRTRFPVDHIYGPSISAISATPDFKPTQTTEKNRTSLIVGIVVVVGVVFQLLAWHLYKNNCQLELVDSKLSELCEKEVKDLIGVALLCTQTLPSSRPLMSRVIAMLCGDMEVSRVNSKPAYLTEWAFDDVTTFFSDDINEECEDTSHYVSSTRVPKTDKSPEISDAEALLH